MLHRKALNQKILVVEKYFIAPYQLIILNCPWPAIIIRVQMNFVFLQEKFLALFKNRSPVTASMPSPINYLLSVGTGQRSPPPPPTPPVLHLLCATLDRLFVLQCQGIHCMTGRRDAPRRRCILNIPLCDSSKGALLNNSYYTDLLIYPEIISSNQLLKTLNVPHQSSPLIRCSWSEGHCGNRLNPREHWEQF